jgi:hypothetical protein
MAVDTISVLVPEAAVDEDDLARRRKDDVGTTGKVSSMQTEAIAQSMSQGTHDQFGLGIPASNAPHVFSAASS